MIPFSTSGAGFRVQGEALEFGVQASGIGFRFRAKVPVVGLFVRSGGAPLSSGYAVFRLGCEVYLESLLTPSNGSPLPKVAENKGKVEAGIG